MNPILLNIPTSLETERLHLRKPFPGDGEDVYDSILASHDYLKQWLAWAASEEPSLENTEAHVRQAHVDYLARKNFHFHLYKKEDGAFIGKIALHPINWDIPIFEIDCWIQTSYQQQGYATESVYAICYFAFQVLKAKRVEIRCDSLNIVSRNVAEKTGFHLEGTLHNSALSIDGKELRHTCIYGKTKALQQGMEIVQ